MESIITRIRLRHPFRTQRRNGIQTYGYRLTEHSNNADPNLLDIVMRCQVADPAQRPSVEDLLSHASRYMPAKVHPGTHEETLRFWSTILKKPPPPQTPMPNDTERPETPTNPGSAPSPVLPSMPDTAPSVFPAPVPAPTAVPRKGKSSSDKESSGASLKRKSSGSSEMAHSQGSRGASTKRHKGSSPS